MMNSEIKSCPFCDGTDTLVVWEKGIYIYWVKCYGCGATGSHKASKAEAIMAWNSANQSKLQKLKRVTDIVNG